MLNNEAGQNYVVLACKLWGIPRPVRSSEGSEPKWEWLHSWGEGVDAEYENGINVARPKGRSQCGNLLVCCLWQQRKEAFIFQPKLCFYDSLFISCMCCTN